MSSSPADDVRCAVLGTIAVARHCELLIERQKYHLAKYGEGAVLPDDRGDPVWVASKLRMVSVMTGVAPRSVPDMVHVAGADILSLTANSIMRTVLELKALVPNGDVAHVVALEPTCCARRAATRTAGRPMGFCELSPARAVRSAADLRGTGLTGKGGIERRRRSGNSGRARGTCARPAGLDDDDGSTSTRSAGSQTSSAGIIKRNGGSRSCRVVVRSFVVSARTHHSG